MNKKGYLDGMEIFGIIVGLIFVVLLIGLVIYGVNYAFTSGEEIITVKTKWTKIVDGTEKYRITSTNGQTFVVKDSLVNKQFESASLYANIDEGETYKLKTQGFRFGFFSDFKNIVGYTKQ